MVPVEEPVSAPDLLALVSHIPASVCRLVKEKKAAASKCAELEKQLAQEREAGHLLQQMCGKLQREEAVLSAEHFQLNEDEHTTLSILQDAFKALADPLGSLRLGATETKDNRTARA